MSSMLKFIVDTSSVKMLEYMRSLSDSDEGAFKKQFSQYIKEGITPDTVSSFQVVCSVSCKV